MSTTVAQRPIARLLRYLSPHRPALVIATVHSVLNKLFDLAPPVLIGAAVDVVASRQDSLLARLGVDEPVSQLWVLALVTLLVWGFESLFEYWYALRWRGLAQTVQHELRREAYAHVQRLDLAYFEDRSTGGLMAILNDDVNQLERFLDDGANELIQLATTIVVVGTMFIAAVPSVSWMTLLPMPVVIWGSVWFQGRLQPHYVAVRERVSALSALLANNLSGIATIKSFAAEKHEERALQAESLLYADANRRAIALSSAFVPLIRMVIVTGFCAILIYGGRMALDGELNIGLYSVLVFMTQRLLWPLTRLGSMLDQYQRAMASTSRVLDLLDTRPQLGEADDAVDLTAVSGAIGFERVSFHYDVRALGASQSAPVPTLVLRELDLQIEAGQTVAFVGATGAGKTTLIKLLLRFYDPRRGTITLDGVDLRRLRLTSLRRAIGLVSQDVFLFHGSVRENITYGSFGVPSERIEEAAKIAEAHDFITKLPHGYDTIVGERGQKLSGGQRQRISIARAIVKDPPVLVLDEATSSVDNETEAAIQRSLERIAIGRTTIVIAHRLSTVRHADRIFVLDQGAIAEVGTHDELVERQGIYAKLWRVQTGLGTQSG